MDKLTFDELEAFYLRLIRVLLLAVIVEAGMLWGLLGYVFFLLAAK